MGQATLMEDNHWMTEVFWVGSLAQFPSKLFCFFNPVLSGLSAEGMAAKGEAIKYGLD